MFTLYGVYRSRALRVVWLAKEMGLEFRHVPVIQRHKLGEAEAGKRLHSRSAAFLAINPNGHIPSIEDDGLVLHESLAINLYLARKHGGPLAPADLREEGLAQMWTLWAATEVEPHALIFLQQGRQPEGMRDVGALARASEALRAPYAVLDGALKDRPWLLGSRFTVADINVAEVVRASQGAPALFNGLPRLQAWLGACQARPAYIETMALREAEPE